MNNITKKNDDDGFASWIAEDDEAPLTTRGNLFRLATPPSSAAGRRRNASRNGRPYSSESTTSSLTSQETGAEDGEAVHSFPPRDLPGGLRGFIPPGSCFPEGVETLDEALECPPSVGLVSCVRMAKPGFQDILWFDSPGCSGPKSRAFRVVKKGVFPKGEIPGCAILGYGPGFRQKTLKRWGARRRVVLKKGLQNLSLNHLVGSGIGVERVETEGLGGQGEADLPGLGRAKRGTACGGQAERKYTGQEERKDRGLPEAGHSGVSRSPRTPMCRSPILAARRVRVWSP